MDYEERERREGGLSDEAACETMIVMIQGEVCFESRTSINVVQYR